MLGNSLGIGHDPGQHVAYIGSWINVLRKDPLELFRASRDAQNIMEYIYSLVQEQSLDKSKDQLHIPAGSIMENSEDKKQSQVVSQDTFLDVPYREKDEAKQLGAYWNQEKKVWYVPKGNDITPLGEWIPSRP
jgi:hypothetical protein